jgi:hypothetical protein
MKAVGSGCLGITLGDLAGLRLGAAWDCFQRLHYTGRGQGSATGRILASPATGSGLDATGIIGNRWTSIELGPAWGPARVK